ncbi:MAG TPA: sigma-54 dependent transcriptional regulator [Pyrinomonadaceae bacterium]|nr:sigma-54 dependent transcriptional regulator [Pyrinomonadaceae bacterium]
MIEIVARSEPMREAVRLAERVAETDANVLITGESGAGKDALASYIHSKSNRAEQPFVKIDCATLPPDLLEAELFGYQRGAFTGAGEDKPGRLEASHKGTLILDEIAYLTIESQAKLLRVIETREFERLGGGRTIKVDARLIALTNVDLSDAVNRKHFREDLYYRLNVVHIKVPSLRERREDLPDLAQAFVAMYGAKHGRPANQLTPAAIELLTEYYFPGNVRELANTIERAVIMSNDTRIDVGQLPEAICAAVRVQQRRTQPPSLAEIEAEYVDEVLAAAKGNKTEAARILGISRKNLYEKLARKKMKEEGENGT